MAKRTFTAKFSNGETRTRKSDHPYTHAWIMVLHYDGTEYEGCRAGTVVRHGFSKSAGNADKSMASTRSAWRYGKLEFSEIVPCEA